MALAVKWLYAALFSTILAGGTSLANAGSEEAEKFARIDELKKTLILVAVPALRGLYQETVVVAVPLGGTHIGFIVNRPSAYTLDALFPGHEPSAKIGDPVYFGGPEMSEAIFAVTKEDTERPYKSSVPLGENLFVTSAAPDVDAIIALAGGDGKRMATTRFLAGFVAWRTNELKKEVDAGYWRVLEAPASGLFFHDKGEGLWKTLIEQLEVKEKAI